MPYKTGDILAVQGTGLFARGIMAADYSCVSHTGIVLTDSPFVMIEEAVVRVRTCQLAKSLDGTARAWLLSDKTLTDQDRGQIAMEALSFSADGYNYGGIVLQALNALSHTHWFTDHFSLGFNHQVICSYVVAASYAKTGRHFGVLDRSVTPADIYLYAQLHPEEYSITEVK